MPITLRSRRNSTVADAQANIDKIRSGVQLSTIVRETVQLTEINPGSFVGTCPWCPADRGTLMVRDKVGYFHCPTCSAGGDVFAFVKLTQGASFTESVSYIAARQLVHDHRPVRFLRTKPAWCRECGLTADLKLPRTLRTHSPRHARVAPADSISPQPGH